MDQPEHTDVVVLGLGPGGEYVAGTLAEAGLHVTGVESRLVGGECPYYGCVPSKMMIRAANLITETRRVPGMAGTSAVTPDWSPVAQRIRDEATDDWNDKVAADRFAGKGGHLVRGRGKITGAGQVTVTGAEGTRVLLARTGIVINTGTDPAIPPLEGLADTPFWTNREDGPGRTGAGVADRAGRRGHRRGIHPGLRPLRHRRHPRRGAAEAAVLRGARGQRADRADLHRRGHQGLHGRPSRAGQPQRQPFLGSPGDEHPTPPSGCWSATGRRTDLAALGVATVGLDPAATTIPTDGWMRAADGVWAIGDVTGKGAFTHMSMYQADIAVRDILGQGGEPADYRAVPRVTFTDPEIGSVGLTEEQARAAGLRVRTGVGPDPVLGPGLDPQGGQRRIHQGGRGRRPFGAGGRELGRPGRRRGPVRPAGRDPGRGAGGHLAQHAVRVPDVLPRHRGRAREPQRG